MDELRKACDEVLLSHFPDSFRSAVDDLLGKGVSPHRIIEHVRRQIGESLTLRQVVAYLESKGR